MACFSLQHKEQPLGILPDMRILGFTPDPMLSTNPQGIEFTVNKCKQS